MMSLPVSTPRNETVLPLVRDRKTQRFVDEWGGWTESIEQALTFPNFLSAVTWCLQTELTTAEVVLKSGRAPGEITIPIG